MSLTKIFKALRVGEQLADPATWKNKQKLVNALIAIIGLAAAFFPEYINLSEEDTVKLAGALAVLFGVGNTVFINATSKKVGVGGKTQ